MYKNLKIGVLGGGQLGRMMIQSSLDFNLDIRIMDPDPAAPCQQIASKFVAGSITEKESVLSFGRECDIITIEIENVNTEALKILAAEGKKVYPQPEIIEMIQDKSRQKLFYQEHGFPTSEFVLTKDRAELDQHVSFLPAVHKLAREGYDGRGVQKIFSTEDLQKGFDAPGVLEKFVDFEKEIAVITARTPSGKVTSFPVVELAFHPEKNLVEYLFSPADLPSHIVEKASKLAVDLTEKLGIAGLLAVEMFVTKSGEILINEIAPRPHNSGHHTIEANATSQFEQHLRAILDLPLGDTKAYASAAMVNLLGEDGYTGDAIYQGVEELLALEDVHIHLYGKKITKPFRKMGHVTLVDQDVNRLKQKAEMVKQTLKIIA